NTTIGTNRGENIAAYSLAARKVLPTTYCVLSLGSGDALHIDGGNSLNWVGCTLRSNGDVTCNGNNASGNADNIVYAGDNKNGKCSPSNQNTTATADPYASKAANIPDNSCTNPNNKSTYPHGSSAALVTSTSTWSAVQTICGDLRLGANLTFTNNQ